jgi:hypothetical protein
LALVEVEPGGTVVLATAVVVVAATEGTVVAGGEEPQAATATVVADRPRLSLRHLRDVRCHGGVGFPGSVGRNEGAGSFMRQPHGSAKAPAGQ